MMESENLKGPGDEGGSPNNCTFEEVLAQYFDRLNSGEMLHPEEVERRHPEWAQEILSQLQVFQQIGENELGAT